jgi:hypothetical protein
MTPAVSQQTQVSVPQIQQFAVEALQRGDAGVAARAADLLIARNPKDARALIWRTEAAILASDWEAAVSFGSRAFWSGSNARQRYSAAQLVALAHNNQDHFTRAQAWLRLARQDAPNEEAREAIARSFQAVRSRNPLSVNLRFGITPTTNVNNGSSNDTSELFGLGVPFSLSGNAQALSGWEFSSSADLRYLVHSNETSATFLDAALFARTYRLTESGRDQAEDGIDGSDFSNATLSVGATHRFVLNSDMQPTSTSLSFAQNWQGGDVSDRFITASARHSWKISDVDAISISGYARKQLAFDGDDAVTSFSTTTSWLRDLNDLGSLRLSMTAGKSQSEDTDQVYDSLKYGLGYAFPEPIYGVQLSGNINYEDRDYETSVYAPVLGRSEKTTSISVRAEFTDVEFLGFHPVVILEKVARDASLPFFERDYTSFGFDISSSF